MVCLSLVDKDSRDSVAGVICESFVSVVCYVLGCVGIRKVRHAVFSSFFPSFLHHLIREKLCNFFTFDFTFLRPAVFWF